MEEDDSFSDMDHTGWTPQEGDFFSDIQNVDQTYQEEEDSFSDMEDNLVPLSRERRRFSLGQDKHNSNNFGSIRVFWAERD